MDLRGGRERATLSEQMTKLQNSMQNRDRKRAQGRQQRKREHSDDSSGDEEGKGRTRRRAVEHGLLNLGTGALAEGAAHAGFSWRCELCQITLSSEASKHQHLQGAAHLKAEKRARAMEEAGRMDPVQQQKAQAALAMAGWTAGSQGSSEYVSKLVVKEVVKAVDHYGAEIKAKGLMPHCPDSGLVHRGAGYKVIQGKMSSHLGRPSGDKHRIAKTPAKPLNTGSNLPLQGSVAGECRLARTTLKPARCVRVRCLSAQCIILPGCRGFRDEWVWLNQAWR
mmetsp:Transcript_28074/g.53126  ORF Transcript_28074/g.53126 Transcript_28074/m.53126 type:complete len:280 (+) Transcript_28074:145-984(+)